jgi:hypothetical protein
VVALPASHPCFLFVGRQDFLFRHESERNFRLIDYLGSMQYLFCFLFVFTAALCTLAADVSPLSNPSVLLTRAIQTESGRKDIGFDVLPLSDGAIISGSTSINGGSVDGLLLRVNERGDVLWRKVFGGTGLDLIFSALPDGANGFVCVGFKAPTGAGGLKAMDGWIFRIDEKGELTWEHTYGGDGEDRLTGIRKTPDGWIAAGHREMNGKIQAWVLRIDENGKEVNSWTYDSSLPGKGLDVLPIADGGFVFVGGEGEARETSDGFVVRVDANGRKLWQHPIGGDGFQVGYHLQQFQDGTFLVIGYGATNNRTDHDAYIMRITPEGRILYHKNFGGPTHDRATNALILENDALIVVGQTQRPGAAEEDSGWDMIIYATDSKSDPVWSARYGGEGVEFGRAVKGAKDKLWIIGHTTSADQTSSSVLLIRMDASSLVR